ncbi:MAG: phytanoyl-CoA dioxygenase family protein [Sandaracinaceae bacterium]
MSQDGHPLPGVPLVESPFFEEVFTPESHAPATLELARALHEDGFAVLDFPDDDIDRVADGIRERLESRFNWQEWRDWGIKTGDGMRLQDAWRYDEGVRRLATNEAITELLSTLYGRRAWPFQTLTFPVGTQQHYHSDAVHFSCVPERFMCGVWIALEDVHEDAGPLVYYPGSHRWPIYGNEHIGRHAGTLGYGSTQEVFEPLWEALIRVHGAEPKRFSAKKGQALIWAANLLHGGEPQRSPDRTRWSLVTHYYFDDCVYYTPMNSDPFQGNIDLRRPLNLLTGEPTVPTLVGHEPRPDFVEAVRIREPDLPDGFDEAEYYAANPDVERAGMDAAEHWVLYGQHEGRQIRPDDG